MNNIEIFINSPSNYRLDVGDFDMSFNYSFNDIRDITKRNSSYSKTITIPGTKNNNYVLGGLFDINSNYTLFNPNIKIPASVNVNSETIIQGFLILNSIDKLNNVDSQGNSIYYNLTIYSNSVDLLDIIGEKTIGDLVTLEQYNHTFDSNNILASWNNVYTDGYVYPLYPSIVDDDFVEPEDEYIIDFFHPSIFYKSILDAIISEAGYGWNGTLKDNEQFENEVILYTGGATEILDDNDVALREFDVNYLAANLINIGECNDTINVGDEFNIANRELVPFDNIINDPSNQFDTGTNIYTAQLFQICKFKGELKFELSIFSNDFLQTPTGDRYTMDLHFEMKVKRTTTVLETIYSQTIQGYQPPQTITAFQQTVFATDSISFETDDVYLSVGDEVYIEVYGVWSDGKPYRTTGTPPVKRPVFISTKFTSPTNLSNIINSTTLFNGATINLRKFFNNIKQKDLIVDLIKRYNLIISNNADNPNILAFDTYNGYYESNTEILDWSDKKDYSKQDKIEFLPDLQPESMLFTYTKDDDDYNKAYTDTIKETFGQYELIFDESANGRNDKIQTPFSPTPSVKTSFGAILPSISRTTPKGKPRVLYYGGLKPTISGKPFLFDGVLYTDYPYVGHFDDPILPNLDLNYDTCPYYFYDDLEKTTTNTQYNLYWSTYVNQIQNGRMLTAYFYLNEIDIKKVKDKLSFKFWVKDSYYYINNIIDYNPMNNMPTKVELLKVNDLGKYYSDDGNKIIPQTTECPNDLYIEQQSIDGVLYSFYKSTSNQTITEDCCISLGGQWDSGTSTCFVKNDSVSPNTSTGTLTIDGKTITNITNNKLNIGNKNKLIGEYSELIIDANSNEDIVTYKNKQFTFGNDNFTNSNNSFIIGSNNEVLRSGVSILNANNNTVEAINSTIIGTEGQTITDSNSIYFGNAIRVENETGKYYVNGVEVDVAHKINRRITSTEILELNTNPIKLLDNVGVNKYPIIEDCAIYLTNGNLYNEDHQLQVYVDGAETIYYKVENTLSVGSPNGIYHLEYAYEKKPDKSPLTHTLLDGAIFIRNSVDMTGGDLDLIITIHYRIVDINEI